MADILIVGADQGIGYFLAESLLENGDRVAVLDTARSILRSCSGSTETAFL